MLEESNLVAIQVDISLFALLDRQICQSGISEVHLQQVKTILYPFHNFSNLSRVKELDDLCFILYTLNCFETQVGGRSTMDCTYMCGSSLGAFEVRDNSACATRGSAVWVRPPKDRASQKSWMGERGPSQERPKCWHSSWPENLKTILLNSSARVKHLYIVLSSPVSRTIT